MIRGRRGRWFCCVNDDVPAPTTDLLRRACRKRALRYVEVSPAEFDFDPARRLRAGDLLYRPAVSFAAQRVEQFLYAPGVATFYADPALIYYDCVSSTLVFERAGLRIPATVFCAGNRRAVLRDQVKRLGGLPVVVKVPGWSGGVGVMKVDSFPALFSLVDYLLAARTHPHLCAFVGDAVHWRVIVVGTRAIAWYRNPVAPDDFRSFATDRRTDAPARLEPRLAELAVGAARALRLEFAGVDLLRTAGGEAYLLEANFPCYFPHAQKLSRIDVAGRMIDHLLAKAGAALLG